MTLRVGMGQMLVEGGAAQANLARAVAMIDRAAREKCSLVVLPECLDAGWTHPSARDLARPIPGESSVQLAEAAREAGVYVVAGLTERDGARLYNAAVLISPAGDILLKHRKINELDIGRDLYATGDRLGVVRTPLGVLGVTICADNFPESLDLAHALARMGCQILLSPCAWAVDAAHDNGREPYGSLWLESYSAIAGRHGIPVIGVSNVGWLTGGPWQGRKCIGNSLAMGAGGAPLAWGPYGAGAEALVSVSLETR
ncbi:MAG: carbon-nitrogen hydrolase family protein [Bryobacterales bacterium]|nr:carbon-nitrogen hydrolase family protein [Bryobacterales bacterium]